MTIGALNHLNLSAMMKTNNKQQAKFIDLAGIPNSGYAKNGETTILGKFWGYDKSISKKEVEDLKKFIETDHKIGGLDFGGKGLFMLYESEFNPLFNSTMSINEFKEKYLETKKRYELRHGYQTLSIMSSVLKNDGDYFTVIKKFNFPEKTKEEQGYNGSPDVKEVENSLYKRYMEDRLSKDEIEILNKFGTDYLVEGVDLSALIGRKVDLLKTLTSMSEFEKIWGAERAQREKQFFNELGKPLTQEEIDRFLTNKNNQKEDKETFKPIQAESKNKETYKDDSKMNELVKKLLEGKFNTSKELELLFGVKFSDDDAGEFNKILSSNSAPKSIDIKA